MSKGNPIVGLAHVVVSQQEMLEKANEQIEELKQELVDLDRIKSQKLEDLYKDFSEASERRMQLEVERNNIAQRNNVLTNEIQEQSGVIYHLRELIAQNEQKIKDLDASLANTRMSMEHIAWQTYDPNQRYAFDEYEELPIIDGLYYHHENSEESFYDKKMGRRIPLKSKFDIYSVITSVKDDYFTIVPCDRGEKGSIKLIAVRITYFSRFLGKKWDEIKSHIFDPTIEERYLEALADPNHADAE